MAGTLTINTLSDGTNSTSSTNCIQGSCKAWVNVQAAGTINASYNVSSVTVLATGVYKVAFTNALTDANYAIFGLPISSAAGDRGNMLSSTNSSDNASVTNQAAGSFCYRIQNPAATLYSEPHSVAALR